MKKEDIITVRVLKDIVIPAGTILSNKAAPEKTEYGYPLPLHKGIEIAKDFSAVFVCHVEMGYDGKIDPQLADQFEIINDVGGFAITHPELATPTIPLNRG